MELKTVRDSFEHVTKKQKLCSSKCHETIEQIGQEIQQALVKLQSIDATTNSFPDHRIILTDLKTKLKEISPLESTQKELNIALSKYLKQLEKFFNSDISKAYRNVDFDIHTVNQIIASHLYRESLFDVGDCFVNEAGAVQEANPALKSPFIEMYHILQAMKSHNLEPALSWVTVNREKLRQNGSDLELKLHRLQYVELLQKRGRDDALKYARTYLSPFATTHIAEIQKLMTCLLWAGKLDSSPYRDLLAPINWEKLAAEFSRQFCSLLGQASQSPLSVTVAAGVQGLPTLLKLMNVMTGKKQEWQSMKQLPVPIDLDQEFFNFHSVFVCPVSRDQATDENPPMMMACGHVLCKQSIVKLSKSSTRTFKCPYCPTAIQASHCRQLIF